MSWTNLCRIHWLPDREAGLNLCSLPLQELIALTKNSEVGEAFTPSL